MSITTEGVWLMGQELEDARQAAEWAIWACAQRSGDSAHSIDLDWFQDMHDLSLAAGQLFEPGRSDVCPDPLNDPQRQALVEAIRDMVARHERGLRDEPAEAGFHETRLPVCERAIAALEGEGQPRAGDPSTSRGKLGRDRNGSDMSDLPDEPAEPRPVTEAIPTPPAVIRNRDGWTIEETSRRAIQAWVVLAHSQGWSMSRCADAIRAAERERAQPSGGESPSPGGSGGIARATLGLWAETDDDFAAALAAAHEEYVDRIEDEVRRRGIEGWSPKPGVTAYSDRLAELVLRAEKPEKYSDRKEIHFSGGVQLSARTLGVVRSQGAEPDVEAEARALLETEHNAGSGTQQIASRSYPAADFVAFLYA